MHFFYSSITFFQLSSEDNLKLFPKAVKLATFVCFLYQNSLFENSWVRPCFLESNLSACIFFLLQYYFFSTQPRGQPEIVS